MQTQRGHTWLFRVLMLFCAGVFLFSAFMTGSYAWDSEQKVINTVYGAKDAMVPVELVKLEKLRDGTETETPIANTAFYLYREGGVQIGGRYVTDRDGKIQVLLPVGNFYFVEDSPSIGYTFDTDANGDAVTQYPFTVTNQQETITVRAYNRRLEGDLLIRKTVKNTDGAPLDAVQAETTFLFTVTFSDGGSYPYRIDGGEEVMLPSGGTLQLGNGQSAVFEDLPVGLLYDVTETPVEGYWTTGTGHRGNIAAGTQAVAEFVNHFEREIQGSLVVSKEVQGDGADPAKEFTFVVTLGEVTEEITLQHGETREYTGIPLGTAYTVTERNANADGYTAMVDHYQGRIVAGEAVRAHFINVYAETPPTDSFGSLSISKAVIGENSDPEKSFTFAVEFAGTGAPENQSVTLKAGQVHIIENIPHGVTFTVTETDTAGYWPTLESMQGTVIGGAAFAMVFENHVPTEVTGSITIRKEVAGDGADPDRRFTFTVWIAGDQTTCQLGHGESKTFDGLPIGTEYTVVEEDAAPDGYRSTVRSYSGRIVDTAEVSLPFVNVYDPAPEGKTGSLTVTKTVTGQQADPDKEFAFYVDFEGENAPADSAFALQAGQSRTFADLPQGVTYTVSETDAAGYEAALYDASGVIVGDRVAEVTFTNRVPGTSHQTVRLTVEKRLAGEVPEGDGDREFTMTLTVDGETTDFMLKAGEVKTFEIPVGAAYAVSEADVFGDGYSQSVLNGAGTAADDVEVVVTNTYVGQPRIVIRGEKTWDNNGHADVALPESITIRLKNGDLLVEERVVTPDDDGRWLYSFVVPKYNADGSTAIYTLEEEEVRYFRATYDGYNIVNTYVEPIAVDPPVITKVVVGEDAPSTPFAFVFSGQYGTPMPAGSVGYKKNLTLTGAGQLEIGTITFETAGTYVYTVHEKNDGAEGWAYDTALYTLTVVVTETDHVLHATQTLVKHGVNADEMVFTNRFTPDQNAKVTISGTKTWNYGEQPEAERPTDIVVEVYANGKLTLQRQVTAENDWQYSFVLPRYDADGDEIVYTVDEAAVRNYTKQIDGYDLINTYIGTPEEPDVPVDPDGSDKPDTPNKPVTPDEPSKTPQTNDNSNMTFWMMLMLLSLSGLLVTALLGRRRRAYLGKHARRPRHGK